jgi:hypothetical protein
MLKFLQKNTTKGRRMETFLQQFGSKIKGVLTGFDRIVFKGCLRHLAYAEGAAKFLARRSVLNKDYKAWMQAQSAALVTTGEKRALEQTGVGITYIPSLRERKEELAHARMREKGVASGLIGVWSCTESCRTFRAVFDPGAGRPRLRPDFGKCKHLYFYYNHTEFGFMSVRLQTWFPYEIQIALNGREWLRRGLERQGVAHTVDGNKFLGVGDFAVAQGLLDAQPIAAWFGILDGFAREAFPTMEQTLGDGPGYRWTLWQSEWATDFIFDAAGSVAPLMDRLLRHELANGTGERVLRYFGKPVRPDGQPHPLADPDILSRANRWYNGMRMKHWLDGNSVKFYNEHNALRFETTLNNPAPFKVWRCKEGAPDGPKERLPLRKGVADIPLRAKVCGEINARFIGQAAQVKDTAKVREIVASVGRKTRDGRPVRTLDILGKDRELLAAVADPTLASLGGITNKALQQTLAGTEWAKGMTGKRLSARIGRNLRLLRDHGLISKVPEQRKYYLSDKGRRLTALIPAILSASTEQLTQQAA